VGLLVLRFTLCAFLLNLLFSHTSLEIDTVLAALAALLVTIGFLTPIAGVLAALSFVWNGIVNHCVWPCVLAAPIGLAISLVGPGAFSLDAYRFGRKRVIFDDRRD
jgi:pilus assembly protein TadC